MTERERLIELLQNAQIIETLCTSDGKPIGTFAVRAVEDGAEGQLADYLLANGVIVPPCKVGDNCYPLPRYRTPLVERKISRITYSKRNTIIGYYENDGQYRPPLRTRILGEDVFLSREEAEKALKGGAE